MNCMRTIAIVIPPSSGTLVFVDKATHVTAKDLDPSGVTNVDRASDGSPVELHVKAAGYQDYDTMVDVPASGNVQIRIGIPVDAGAPVQQVYLQPMLPVKPPAPPVPRAAWASR